MYSRVEIQAQGRVCGGKGRVFRDIFTKTSTGWNVLGLGKEVDVEGGRGPGPDSVAVCEAHTKPRFYPTTITYARLKGEWQSAQRALFQLHSQPLPTPPQALHTQMLTAVQEISHLIEPLASAARAEASQLGHKVRKESCGV